MTLDQLNALSPDAAKSLFLEQCHSHTWAQTMADARPFASIDSVLACAEQVWQNAREEDILDAFSGHAKIGDLAALRNKFASAEQGQVAAADDTVLLALRDRNDEYLAKFGFIFIVCATGKPAAQMLALLLARLANSRQQELANGAAEQAKITALRLRKLLDHQ